MFCWQSLVWVLVASAFVWERLKKSESTFPIRRLFVPLTEAVTFTTRLQKGNRIQIPVLVRWRYKLEPVQVLRVTVHAVSLWGSQQTFHACMSAGGRITIPRLVRDMLTERKEERERVIGAVLEVRIEPA